MKRIIQLYDEMWEKGFRYCVDFQDTLVLLQFLSDEGKFGNVFQTMNPKIKQQKKQMSWSACVVLSAEKSYFLS